MINKEFLTLPIDEVIPYENNPRVNDTAVNDVVASIRQCENIDPIEVDENNIILSGHTRLKALKATLKSWSLNLTGWISRDMISDLGK